MVFGVQKICPQDFVSWEKIFLRRNKNKALQHVNAYRPQAKANPSVISQLCLSYARTQPGFMSSSRPVAETFCANFRSARMPIIARCRCKGFFRKMKHEAIFFAGQREFMAQGAVANDATRRGDATDAVSFGRADGFGNEHFDDGGLNASAEVADFLRVLQQRRVSRKK